jgi:hypothetical protein
VRHVFVLSRDHPWSPWLYDYLHERFESDAHVEIVVDRRRSQRRAGATGTHVTRERRTAERRRPLAPDEDLRVRSHYIVDL